MSSWNSIFSWLLGVFVAIYFLVLLQAVEKVLAGAIRREMALEEYCNKQAFDISQLNRLVCSWFACYLYHLYLLSISSWFSLTLLGGHLSQVQQYKHERECNAVLGQAREDKILRLESLMDGVLPTEEFMEEELVSLTHEHKVWVFIWRYFHWDYFISNFGMYRF